MADATEHRPADMQIMRDCSGDQIPRSATFSLPFDIVRKLVEESPAPRRPSRNKPVYGNLTDEFAAWEAASDEAWESIDDVNVDDVE
jgi:hypothetical protein